MFPKSASVDQLKLVRQSIAAERDQRLSGEPSVQSTPQAATASTSAQENSAAAASSQPVSPPSPRLSSLVKMVALSLCIHYFWLVRDLNVFLLSCQESSMSFYVTLQSNFQHVMMYENPELQQKARNHIPLQQLTSAAQHKLKEAKTSDPGFVPKLVRLITCTVYLDCSVAACVRCSFVLAFLFVDCKLGIEDLLVLELLKWFKQDFFTWVDCLPCSHCGGQTQNSSSLSPTSDDLHWGAQRVENHYCQSCQISTRFPRFVCVGVHVCLRHFGLFPLMQ